VNSDNVTFKKRKLNDFAESKEEPSTLGDTTPSDEGASVIKPKVRNYRKKG
jgi:hypothetical protein